MALGHQQQVPGEQGLMVQEGQGELVLEHLVGGQLPGNDAAEFAG